MGSSTEGSGTRGDRRAGALPIHSPVPEFEGKEGSHSRKPLGSPQHNLAEFMGSISSHPQVQLSLDL